MKTLVIGSNGQLGSDLVAAFESHQVIPLTHEDIEITDFDQSRKILEQHRPETVINTAAFHNVPECENKPERAFLVNSIGIKHLSQICQDNQITLAHISTDYIFDGEKNSPYTEKDSPQPLNVYGISKLAGEYFANQVENHYVIRVASLFGTSGCRAKGGGNFVKTMLRLARTKHSVQVTSNVTCSPTYTKDAAAHIRELITEEYPPGIYHAANDGFCSWYEFASEIFLQAQIEITVEEKTEKQQEGGFKRPLYSPLCSEKTKPLRHWKDALRAYLQEEHLT